MRKAIVFLLLIAAASARAQNDANTLKPRIIDVHVHAFDGLPNVGPMCPFPTQFTASDAKAGNEHQLGWAREECSSPLEPGKNADEYMKAVIAEWDRLNVTAVVMGEPEFVKKWMEAAPGRVILGTSFDG